MAALGAVGISPFHDSFRAIGDRTIVFLAGFCYSEKIVW